MESGHFITMEGIKMLEGDSGEYEFLTEAVSLSKDVEGMCIEIGLRRGMGTKTIMDAVREYCPGKVVIAVDPYGSIPYVGREHMGACRLDYTNEMKSECMVDLWTYVRDNPVNFYPCLMTDDVFFEAFALGFEVYDIDPVKCNKYAMAHLDGPHYIAALKKEINWFNERMLPGAVIVIDDVTIDFVDIKPINELFTVLGWSLVKEGFKKNIYVKN